MYDLPKNTMLTYCSNPMFEQMDFGEVPVATLAKEIEKFKKNSKMVVPESDALTFYFMNHAFHVMKSRLHPLERLSDDMAFVADQHIRNTNQVAKRLFFYSVIIAIEEARYMPSQDDRFFEFLNRSYGREFCEYVKGGFKGGLTDFGKLDMTCGVFTTAMMSVFAFGKWQPGFGGRGWVPIAALVSDCANGTLSFEAMADQAFSLCHNNGSMFNKGHLYSQYSHFIYNILDIQDSGQIPQWIASNKGNKFITVETQRVHDIMAKHFPDEMTGKVDTKLVSSSEKAREHKAAVLAKKNQAAWNQWSQQDKTQAVIEKAVKRDGVLMDGLEGYKKPGM
jgi:hypothetical protein